MAKWLVVSASDCQGESLWFKSSILPLLKYACRKRDQLLCWPYTLAKVSHQRWISGNVYHICLNQVQIRFPTLVLKLRGDITRSSKQGHQLSQKWTCVQQNLFLKKVLWFTLWYTLYFLRFKHMLHFLDSMYKLQNKRLVVLTESISPLNLSYKILLFKSKNVESTSIDTQYNFLTSVSLHVII